jgi:predicted ester cyclase
MEDPKSVVSRYINHVWATGDVSALESSLSSDFRLHDHTALDPAGSITDGSLARVRASVIALSKAMPDRSVVIEQVLGEGDLAAIRWYAEGTHTGGAYGVPPTNRTGRLSAMTLARIDGARIVEAWEVIDIFGLLLELGIMPFGDPAPPLRWLMRLRGLVNRVVLRESDVAVADTGAAPAVSESEAAAPMRKYLEEFWGARDDSAVERYADPSIVLHGHIDESGERDVYGLEALREEQKFVLSGVPDFRVVPQHVLVDGDSACVHFTFHGTHTGVLQGVPPTYRKIAMRAVTMSRWRDQKMVEGWQALDLFHGLQQIGVLPTKVSRPLRTMIGLRASRSKRADAPKANATQ